MKFLLGLIMSSVFAFSQEVPPSIPTVFYDFTDTNFPPNVTTIKEASALRVVAAVRECIPVTPTPGFFYNIPGPSGSSQFTEYIPETTCSGVQSKGATSLNILSLGDQSNNLENRNQIYKVGFEILVPEAVIPSLTLHSNDTGATIRGPAPRPSDLSKILLTLREISRTEPPTPTVCTTAAGVISLTKASEITYEGTISSQVTASAGKYPLSVECNKPIEAVFINVPSGNVSYYSIDGSRTISNIPNPALITSLSIYATPDQDARIDEFHIGQTILDPDFTPGQIFPSDAPDAGIFKDGTIDLVKGKSAIAIIRGSANGINGATIPVGVKVDGNLLSLQNAIVGTDGRFIVKTPLDPFVDGNHQVQAVIDPNNTLNESAIDNNVSAITNIRVHQTSPLNIGVASISACAGPGAACYSSVPQLAMDPFVNSAQVQFLTDIFPVADTGQLSLQQLASVQGSRAKTVGPTSNFSQGLLADIQNFEMQRIANAKRKMVAVFDPSYADYHATTSDPQSPFNLRRYTGFVLSSRSLNVTFVRSNASRAMSHELGHALGQLSPEFYGQGSTILIPEGIEWDGTGVNARKQELLTEMTPIMSAAVGPIETFWIEKNTYYKSFVTLLKPEVDPAIIVVGGLVSKTGVITQISTLQSNIGIISPSVPGGAITAKALDQFGQVISQINVDAVFSITGETMDGSNSVNIPLDVTPVVVSFANSPNVASIQLEMSGKVILKQTVTHPVEKATQIIARIPLNGIDGKVLAIQVLTKAAMLLEGAVIDVLVSKKENKKAIVGLNALKLLVKAKVKTSYATTGNELTRDQVLQMLDAKIGSLM